MAHDPLNTTLIRALGFGSSSFNLSFIADLKSMVWELVYDLLLNNVPTAKCSQ